MTVRDDARSISPVTDAAITAMLEHRARRGDESDLRGLLLSATLSVPQNRGWRSLLRAAGRPRLARGLIIALIAVIALAIALVGSGALRPDLAPKAITKIFALPFEYVLPAQSGLRPAPGGPQREIIAWCDGPPDVQPSRSSLNLYGCQHEESGFLRGIVVASSHSPWSHSSTGRFLLAIDPSGFLADLRDTAGLSMTSVAETTVDSRPARTATLTGGRNDVHVSGSMEGLTGGRGFILAGAPARMTVAEVERTTVIIVAWARTTDDLDAWLPVANAFISSIHFVPESRPSAP